MGGKSFPQNCENDIFRYVLFEIFFRANFAYLAAPYRAAAALEGAPTDCKSTEAAGGKKKRFPKLGIQYFQIIF